MIVNIRSPYIITVNEGGQTGSKLELFIWNSPNSEPTTPTYTLSMPIPSNELTTNTYNISSYLEEYIDNIKPIYTSGNEDSNKMFAYAKIKRYKLVGTVYSLLDTIDMVAVDGYTTYLEGLNFVNNSNTKILADNSKEIIYSRDITTYPYINYISKADAISVVYADLNNGNQSSFNLQSTGLYKMFRVPVTTSAAAYNNGNTVTINGTKFKVTPECSGIHKPVLCSFINRYGGWSFITFIKAQTNSIEVKGTNYSLLPSTVNYDVSRGQGKTFNTNGNQSVKLNTGWVPENYSELITELLLSETVLLDGKSAQLKTKSTELKSYTKDKLINYEIEFMYNFDLRNNVV